MIFPLNIYHFLTSPITYLQGLESKHGPLFPLSLPGVPTIWLTSNSELTKTIFTAPIDSFRTSENNPVAPLLGDNGLIMLSGNAHLEQRKEFSGHFSKRNLTPFTQDIHNIFLKNLSSEEKSGVIDLQNFSLEHTLEIILCFLFPHLTPEELIEAQSHTKKFLKSYSASFLFIPKWVPGTWGNFTRKKNYLDQRFYDFYLKGLNSNIKGPLEKLTHQSKEQVLDHIRTFIVAGHETSATSLVWALYYIHKNIDVKNKLLDELNPSLNMSDSEFIQYLLEASYLDAIVSETFRIQPPVPFVTRKITNRDFTLGKRLFKVNEEIGVCISLLHQDKKTWDRPLEFNPQRFLDKKYSPFEYAPFGGGTRKCIGAELAILELKIIIGLFMKNYKADLKSSEVPSSFVLQITIGPKKPILLNYKKMQQ